MPLTVGNVFGTTPTARGIINARQAATMACSCPACTGLQCLDRPRFFAGQLLSEAELNGEIDYVLAKQRLHNRYLHGVGTVCGLEVVCSTCDGQVVVKPGYAIDPCGNDVIVCQEQQFDVIKAIKACCDAVKKKNKTGCDPYQPFNEGCTGQEQKWCITIAYQETPAQPVTPLRSQPKTCSCTTSSSASGCGCGSSKSNGSSSTQSNGCSPPPSAPAAAATSCEPTRVLEGFQLGIVPDPGDCTTSQNLLQGTLLGNLGACIATLVNLQSNFSTATWQILTLAFTQKLAGTTTANADAFLACCQFRQFVVDLFTNSNFATNCTALYTFDSLPCPQPPAYVPNRNNELLLPPASDPAYLQQVQDSINLAAVMLLEYMRECICHTLLPPCPSDPGDDRLILACLTIKDGKITNICNFGCRQFAGSFPSFFYWLSLIPIIPIVKLLVDDICCGPAFLTRQSPLVDNLAKIDPAGLLKGAIMDGNFALPRMLVDRVGDVFQKLSLQGLIGSIPANGLNLATLRGMSSDNAASSLKQFQISYAVQEVNSRADIPLVPPTPTALGDLVSPFAQAGDHVLLYETNGRVVEVQRAGTTPGYTEDVVALRRQLEAMQADIADLRKNATGNK